MQDSMHERSNTNILQREERKFGLSNLYVCSNVFMEVIPRYLYIFVWRQFLYICMYLYEGNFLIFVCICMKAISLYLYIFVWRQFPNICVYLYEGEFCGKWTILNIETGGQPGAASKSNAILQCEFIQITSTVSVVQKKTICKTSLTKKLTFSRRDATTLEQALTIRRAVA